MFVDVGIPTSRPQRVFGVWPSDLARPVVCFPANIGFGLKLSTALYYRSRALCSHHMHHTRDRTCRARMRIKDIRPTNSVVRPLSTARFTFAFVQVHTDEHHHAVEETEG